MKKLFCLLSAAAVVSSSFAAELPTTRGELRTPVARKVSSTINLPGAESVIKLDSKRQVTRGLQKADGVNSIEGDWTIILGDFYFENSYNDGLPVVYTATLDGTTLTFESSDPFYYNMVAEYDAEERILTFSRTYIGKSQDFYVYQKPYIYNYDKEDLDFQTLEAAYSLNGEFIGFDYGAGIYWEACTDLAGNKVEGVLDIQDILMVYKPISGEWKDMGSAIFMDGWLQPGFNYDQKANQYEVPLQQSVTDQNLYRLVNPYKYGVLVGDNSSKKTGYIVFDVTDPDHVIFKFADAGFANKDMGVSMFFAFNNLGLIQLYNPLYTPEEIIEALGNDLAYTTFKDGVVLLDKKNKQGLWDARFGYQIDPTYGFYWAQQNSQNPKDMSARILFPGADGVESVITDQEGPAEYFSLQGLRIANPQPGQIVIKRSGNSVSKIIF